MPTGTVTYEARIAYGGLISTDVLVTQSRHGNACAKERVAATAVVDSGECDARCGNRYEPVDSQSAPPHPG